MDGYQTMIEFRKESKASLLGDLIEFSFFNQLKRGIISRFPFLAYVSTFALEQLEIPPKDNIIDIFDRAPMDEYIEFNVRSLPIIPSSRNQSEAIFGVTVTRHANHQPRKLTLQPPLSLSISSKARVMSCQAHRVRHSTCIMSSQVV